MGDLSKIRRGLKMVLENQTIAPNLTNKPASYEVEPQENISMSLAVYELVMQSIQLPSNQRHKYQKTQESSGVQQCRSH